MCAKRFSYTGKWKMTKYLAMVSWFLLLLWELMQLISKILSRRLREYFSWQNITEVTMISLTAAFFIKQRMEFCPLHDGKTSFKYLTKTNLCSDVFLKYNNEPNYLKTIIILTSSMY